LEIKINVHCEDSVRGLPHRKHNVFLLERTMSFFVWWRDGCVSGIVRSS